MDVDEGFVDDSAEAATGKDFGDEEDGRWQRQWAQGEEGGGTTKVVGKKTTYHGHCVQEREKVGSGLALTTWTSQGDLKLPGC